MERNAILATVLVILILLGYQWYLARHEVPVQDAPRPVTTQQAEQQKAAPPQAQVIQPTRPGVEPVTRPKTYTPTAQLGLSAKDVVVETPLLRVVLSTAGARATSWQLKAYKLDSGAPVDLVATPGPKGSPGPLAAWADPEQLEAVFQVDKERLDLSQPGASDTVTFSYVAATGLQIQKRLTFRR